MEILKNCCTRCGLGDSSLMKYGYRFDLEANKVFRMICAKCNTERCRKYRSTKKGAENMRKAVYKSIKKYPEKQKAREKLNCLVVLGKIKRGVCETCGSPDTHAHHEDYSKPLNVAWLCRKCHCRLHKKQV